MRYLINSVILKVGPIWAYFEADCISWIQKFNQEKCLENV